MSPRGGGGHAACNDAGVVVAISPHLDDAVFSCGQLLAAHPGSFVITVFAGVPRDAVQQTEWDMRCGFASAAQAVAARRDEDRRALAELQARPCWLDFADSQYGQTPGADDVSDALVQALRELPDGELVVPLGLFHSDHVLAHAGAVTAWRRDATARPLLAYEDVPYRAMRGLLQQRLGALGVAGWYATPVRPAAADHAPAKMLAVQAYASQLRAFGIGALADAHAPERCWRLEPERHVA
jgi:LmbE family N-acetylglucosaminyl deacetylase